MPKHGFHAVPEDGQADALGALFVFVVDTPLFCDRLRDGFRRDFGAYRRRDGLRADRRSPNSATGLNLPMALTVGAG